jgi:hypothetical protein
MPTHLVRQSLTSLPIESIDPRLSVRGGRSRDRWPTLSVFVHYHPRVGRFGNPPTRWRPVIVRILVGHQIGQVRGRTQPRHDSVGVNNEGAEFEEGLFNGPSADT